MASSSGKAIEGHSWWEGTWVGVGFLGLQVEVGKYQVPCGILNHFHCPMSVSPTLSGHVALALPLSVPLDEILDLYVTAGLASDRLAISASSLAPCLHLSSQ